jgi:hypothetical protein
MLRPWPEDDAAYPDSLDAVNAPRWLVIRDRLSRVLEHWPLGPGADLRGALKAKEAALIAEGWKIGDTPRNCSFFFCERDNERWCVSVDHYEPDHVAVGHGSHLGKP